MAKKKLASLLDAVPAVPGRHVTCRVPAKTMAAIERDLKEILAAEADGEVVPSSERIADYLTEEYGYYVSRSTPRTWLRKLRLGASICR